MICCSIPWSLLLLLGFSLRIHKVNSFQFNIFETNRNNVNPTPINSDNRRMLLLSSAAIPLSFFAGGTDPANGLPLFEKKDRRQLELCIVNILRVQYWARNTAFLLQYPEEEAKKKAYLEARLGAKAMVADKNIKIGGGASLFVITLKNLNLKEVLDDLKYYAKSKVMDQYKEDLVESLASLVEFDGLETTQDPSPRSSLTLGMYNNDKSIFVQRMLSERIIPLTDQIVSLFGREEVALCEGYVQQYYPNEMPKQSIQKPPVVIKDTEATET